MDEVGDVVRLEQGERDVLVAADDERLVAGCLQFGPQVAEEVDVGGVDDVEQDLHDMSSVTSSSVSRWMSPVPPRTMARATTASTT